MQDRQIFKTSSGSKLYVKKYMKSGQKKSSKDTLQQFHFQNLSPQFIIQFSNYVIVSSFLSFKLSEKYVVIKNMTWASHQTWARLIHRHTKIMNRYGDILLIKIPFETESSSSRIETLIGVLYFVHWCLRSIQCYDFLCLEKSLWVSLTWFCVCPLLRNKHWNL